MFFYTLALELTILLCFWLCLNAWQREHSTPGRRAFIGLCLSAAIWCLGRVAELRGLVGPVGADRITYLGVLALPALWFTFAAHTARLDVARRLPWLPLALMAPQSALYGLMYAGPWHTLFVVHSRSGDGLVGPLWWVNAWYSWTLVVVGSTLFIATALRWRHHGEWGRRLALGLASLVPVGSNVAYVTSGMTLAHDPTPIALGAAMLALRSAVLNGGILQALPVSQHELVNQLPIGVILTDRAGVVVDLNPAAQGRLGVSAEAAIGRDLDAVIAEADPDVVLDVRPVASWGREVGKLALIDASKEHGA